MLHMAFLDFYFNGNRINQLDASKNNPVLTKRFFSSRNRFEFAQQYRVKKYKVSGFVLSYMLFITRY